MGRGARSHRGAAPVGRARGGRALVGPRLLRQQLRHPRQLGAAPPLRQSLGLPVVGAHHDLLGARRLRDRPHRPARDQYQGGHGRPRGAHPAVGRQPREPAEHRPAPGRGAPPRRPRGHHRRAAHRGRRAVGRGADHPARHRRGAGARHDARADRGGSLRSGVRRAAHHRLRRPRRARAAALARVGRRGHRPRRGGHRGPRAPVRGHAAGHDRAGRQQHAQGRQRLAGRARGGVPARAHRQPGHRGRRPGPAARQQGPRLRPHRHRAGRAAAARRLRAEPDAAHHRGARDRPGARAAPLRHRHAVVVRGQRAGSRPRSRART